MIVICREKEDNSALALTQVPKCDGALLGGLLDQGLGASTKRTASEDIPKQLPEYERSTFATSEYWISYQRYEISPGVE